MQEKHLCRSLFLIKLEALACNFIKKETLALVLSCEFFKISKHTFSYRKRETERQRDRETAAGRNNIAERESTAAGRNSIAIPYINAISRRGHSIDVSDNIYGCLSGSKIMNFSDRFRQCFKLFFNRKK